MHVALYDCRDLATASKMFDDIKNICLAEYDDYT